MVFEGFWEIYTFHPQVAEVSGKKMLTWIPKVLLKVNETTIKPEATEEAEGEADADAEEGGEQ